MIKQVVQAFVLVATTASSAILIDLYKRDLQLPVVAGSALILGTLALVLLEHKYALPLNWWWHRFWYLHDFRRYARQTQQFEANLSAALIKSGKLPAAHVVVDGKRVEFVTLGVQRLRARAQTARLFVHGEPGSGKSFAALQIATDLANAGQWRPWTRIPIFARLDRYRDGSLGDHLGSEVLKTTVNNSGKVISESLDQLMRTGRVALILDAMDETPDVVRTRLLAEMANFTKPARDRVPLLITVRSHEIVPTELQLPLEALEIQPLDDAAVTAFIEAHAARV